MVFCICLVSNRHCSRFEYFDIYLRVIREKTLCDNSLWSVFLSVCTCRQKAAEATKNHYGCSKQSIISMTYCKIQ